MSICQIPESKTVGEIKSAIEDAILEGKSIIRMKHH